MFIPDEEYLNKVRMKGSFCLVIDSVFDNSIFNNFETYAFKKGIAFTNVAGYGYNQSKEMFRVLIYWIKSQAPYLDLVLDYGKANPGVSMRLYL